MWKGFTLFTMSTPRDRILVSAVDLYLEDGFDGFSMRKLARSLGVTAPSLYRHFQGKEQLLLEVVKEAYKVMAQCLHRALGGEGRRRAGAVRYGASHLWWHPPGDGNSCYTRALHTGSAPRGNPQTN